MRTPQTLTRDSNARLTLRGHLREYLENITTNWLLVAPRANPGMLEMFRDRDHPPLRPLLPWSGEFAGKYLTSAVQVLRANHRDDLRDCITAFVRELLKHQAADGYLGPFPSWRRPDSFAPQQWDLWGHYHLMVGLLAWHEDSGRPEPLDAVVRIADLICGTFENRPARSFLDLGSTEMNLAPVHSLLLLYGKTGLDRYRRMAERMIEAFSARGDDGSALAGDYREAPLRGVPFHQTPKPRWESLHPIMGLVEQYWLTGDDRSREAFERLWWSMVEGDRHNTGGFTSGERAVGTPYDLSPIETCCTIAWSAMSVEMLKLTGDPRVADELELSLLNAVAGAHSPTGHWCAYNTPMNGYRRIFADGLPFQMAPGTPELNCCSVNSNRGFGMLSEWACMRRGDSIVLNWLGPSTIATRAAGADVTLTISGEYPFDGSVTVEVGLSKPAVFPLELRIPRWSERTTVRAPGGERQGGAPTGYYRIDRTWRPGDRVAITLDMRPRVWVGEGACAGKGSLYVGPVLLAFDHRYNLGLSLPGADVYGFDNTYEPTNQQGAVPIGKYLNLRETRLSIPTLSWAGLQVRPTFWQDWLPPAVLYECSASDGRTVTLCDFASAGQAGTPYDSWLPLSAAPSPMAFGRENPSRCQR